MSPTAMPTTCPIGTSMAARHQLVIPYTLDTNDMRFATPQGFNSGDQFFSYLKDTFDVLYAEGADGAPKMMNIGLHCRLVGRPGRTAALARFIDYVKSHDKVWIARRIDIADHWAKAYPFKANENRPSRYRKRSSLPASAASSNIRTGSPGVPLPANCRLPTIRRSAFMQRWPHFARRSEKERLGVLNAHPDLAGKLAQARRLTESSTSEQASAGLDALTDAERERFTILNGRYVKTFGFPFIIAVTGLGKDDILAAFNAASAMTGRRNSKRPAARSSGSPCCASPTCCRTEENGT